MLSEITPETIQYIPIPGAPLMRKRKFGISPDESTVKKLDFESDVDLDDTTMMTPALYEPEDKERHMKYPDTINSYRELAKDNAYLSKWFAMVSIVVEACKRFIVVMRSNNCTGCTIQPGKLKQKQIDAL